MKINRLRNLFFGLAALLMLGHSMVPHDHSGAHPPKFILWQLFSVDLGGDHLQHFAHTSCETAPQDANQQQLPILCESDPAHYVWSGFNIPALRASAAEARTLGHLTSWSRRPPPSKFS